MAGLRFTGIIIFLLLLILEASAQFYPARTYSLRDGMPANAIYDITQVDDGTMWFLSSKGVFTYNSAEWELFPDSLGLPNSPSSRMLRTADGTVWVAGQQRQGFVISYYKQGRWFSIDLPKKIRDIEFSFTFNVELINEKATLYIGHFDKLYVVDSDTSKYSTYNIDNEVIIYDITTGKDIILSTTNGLYKLENGLVPFIEINTQLPDMEVLTCTYHKDILHILGLGWIAKVENGKVEIITDNLDISTPNKLFKHNLTIDPLGRIFFSSNTPARYYDEMNKIAHNLFVNGRYLNVLSNKIFVDRENNVWVGDHRGLFKFSLLRFLNFNKNTQLSSDEVSAILEIGDRHILANTRDLNFLQKDRLLYHIPLPKIPDLRVLDMAEKDGSLFLATSAGGLIVVRNNSLSTIDFELKGIENSISSVEFFNDKLYFCTNQGLYTYENGQINKVNGLNAARNLKTLGNDTLAVLRSARGLYLMLKDDSLIHYKSEDRKLNNVYSIINWRNRYLVATKGGIGTLKNNEIVPVKEFESLQQINAYCFTVDRKDRLWIGSNEGVFIYDGKKLKQFTQSDGLVGNEVNRNALITDKNGRVWIGTEMGASVYNGNEDMDIEVKPNLQLSKIQTQSGTNLQPGQSLSSKDNTINFQFLGISFFDEEQLGYRYKLDGFDQDWTYLSHKIRNVRYTNLPPGNYSFNIQAGIAGDNWSENQSFGFSIDRPIYSKVWFIAIISALTIGSLYAIYRIRFYIVLKNQEKLKTMVMKRTAEIARKNDEIASQNLELKQQSEEIASINERLEEIVKDRTRKVVEQNDQLMKYTFINSHKLRAPICRILGLLALIQMVDGEERVYIIEQLEKASAELDEISREINDLLENVIPDEDPTPRNLS